MTHIAQPNPPRYWWLKRLSLIGLMLLLCVIGLRLCWGWYWSNQLEAMVQSIAGKGEPIFVDDMRIDPVADEDNKLYYLKQARAVWPTVEAAVSPNTRWRREDGLIALETEDVLDPLETKNVLIIESAWWRDRKNQSDPIRDNQAYLDQIESSIALLRKAKAAPYVYAQVELANPASTIRMPYLRENRELAQLLGDAIDRSIAIGDVERGLDYLQLLIGLAKSCETPTSGMIGHLVDISIQAIALQKIAEQAATVPQVSARNHAHTLIQQLLDESNLQKRFTHAWQSERWSNYNTFIHFINTSGGVYRVQQRQITQNHPGLMAKFVLWMIKPLFTQDAVLNLTYMSDYFEASSDSPTLPDFQNNSQRSFSEIELLFDNQSFRYLLSRMTYPGTKVAIRTHYQIVAVRRLAATALAIRLFEIDHGRRPNTLTELVPDYLPAVPTDPWSLTGAPIQYLPNGALLQADRYRQAYEKNTLTNISAPQTGGPAILYSVGNNQVDNDGIVLVGEDGRIDVSMRVRHPDHWFPLEDVSENCDAP